MDFLLGSAKKVRTFAVSIFSPTKEEGNGPNDVLPGSPKKSTPKKSPAANKLKKAATKVKAVNALTKKSPSKRVAKKSTPSKKSTPKKSPAKKNWAKVKKEVMKSTPRRSARSGIKKGFYNEARLAQIVWKGQGTNKDPIQFK
ncbi:hypothetical protein TrLO_g5140 [Triparma laevis f. longispina]|uniref:Uncharacterized protein n=1 Tax=Triparma laevis f. longispina TaxID=1714387 RepID=A0A9W7KTM3_9STRA|nr:hypothetical protein TrLO_g5140 [Triparma laevis f. longispina]